MNKALVVYYSYSGNSKKIAEYTAEKLSADLLELEPSIPFSDNYDSVVDEWQNNDIKRTVEIKPINIDLNKYNKVVLITCVWWYGISPVMKQFLNTADLSNKDIIVAASNAGWLGHSLKDYETLLHNSNIVGELDLKFSAEEGNRSDLKTSYKDIDNWISKIK